MTRARVADSRWRVTADLAGTRQAQRRPQPENNGCRDGQHGCKSERGHIDRDLVEARQDGRAETLRESLGEIRSARSLDGRDADIRERHSCGPAEQRQQQTFGHHLRDDSPTRRAERTSHREFLVATRAACEQQVRDVSADEQQHGADGEHQQPKCRRRASSCLVQLAHDLEARPPALHDLRAADPRANHIRFDGCVLDRYAVAEARAN